MASFYSGGTRTPTNWGLYTSGPFNTTNSGYDFTGTGLDRYDLLKSLLDTAGGVWGAKPADYFNVPYAPPVPGVAPPAAQAVSAVDTAAGKAKTQAQSAAASQRSEGLTAASEIAAAKGKTGGSGVVNIAAGIGKEVDQNLADLIAQITGTQTAAQQQVQNLGVENEGLFDQFATQIAEIAAGNQGLYNTANTAANQQFNTMFGESTQSLLNAILNTKWGGTLDQTIPDPLDPTKTLPNPNLYSTPTFKPLTPFSVADPGYTSFESLQLPEYSSADLQPFIDQFDTFKLGELQSLGGALNQGSGEGAYGRGGRGQWNIPGVDLGTQFQDTDWIQQLLAQLGQGGF